MNQAQDFTGDFFLEDIILTLILWCNVAVQTRFYVKKNTFNVDKAFNANKAFKNLNVILF